jgi:hypothetical protein
MKNLNKMCKVESNMLDEQIKINVETLSVCEDIIQHPHLHRQHVIAMAKETIIN